MSLITTPKTQSLTVVHAGASTATSTAVDASTSVGLPGVVG